MAREAPRTLLSLSPGYQRGVDEKDYEVIVVDNGSENALDLEKLRGVGANLHYHYIEKATPSPAPAMNFGVRQARGRYLGLMIDGARIASPGLIRYALKALNAYDQPVVTALAWHLGPKLQRAAVRLHGYNQEREDALLAQIGWPSDGYRLFEISSLGGSSRRGWLTPKIESSSLFMHRSTFEQLGGYDERFDSAGGGLVSADMYNRACEVPGSELVMLLGEGTFHQMHGGAMTGADEQQGQALWRQWAEQYERITGKAVAAPNKDMQFIGHVPRDLLELMLFSVQNATQASM